MAIRNSTMAECTSVLPSVEYEDIVSGQGILDKDIREKEIIKVGIRFEPGDVLFGKLRPYLKNWILPDFPGVAVGDFWVLRPSETDSNYLYYLIQTPAFQTAANQSTGTKMPRSDWNLVSKTSFFAPRDKAEQSKIGQTLQALDHLITLHQRKLNHLQDEKKGLLQKMFPKEGEDFPELRFPGYTEAWEQRKAVSIFQTVSDKNHPELPVLSASQELGMIRRDQIGIDIKYDEKSTKTYKRVTPGQFVIHLRSFQGGFAHSNVEGITSPAYTVLDFKDKSRHDDKFWREVFTSSIFIKHLETVTYGIRDGRSISFTDFSTLKFYFPSFEEQKKIGEFFNQLDHLITLHQRKLEHLQDRKKALLQQMFI
jgi:type I restriction enzyme S subunit